MNIKIRLAKKSDLKAYTILLQKTYQVTYTNEKIGLTSECFSEEIFNNHDTQKYLLSNLKINSKQKCWLAFEDKKLVGAITITERENDYELRGFYVDEIYQNSGVGKSLWARALRFVNGKDITCESYTHNKKAINIYKKWGFEIDKKRGSFKRHWPEWPEGVEAECIYLRLKV